MEMNHENWETPVPLPDMEQELKKIRKDLRRRSWKIVFTSLALAAAIVFASVQYAIPALEKQYWDPNTSTYVEGVPDLKLTMDVYTELFCPGYRIKSFEIAKDGFANYTLDVGFEYLADSPDYGKYIFDSYRSGSVDQNTLTLSKGFWSYDYAGKFSNRNQVVYVVGENPTADERTVLAELPEYIHVLSCVTFSEPLSMSDIIGMQTRIGGFSPKTLGKADILWLAISNGSSSEDVRKTCGFNPNLYIFSDYFDRGNPDKILFDKDSAYPQLTLSFSSYTARSLENHFKSLLKFSRDQLENGTGIPSDDTDLDYYSNVLAYVEENGVNAFGAYIISTPQALIDLYEEGIISDFIIGDSWVSFS